MRSIATSFFTFVFLFSLVYGNWEEDYYFTSHELIKKFEEFKNPEYLNNLESLIQNKTILSKNKKIQKMLHSVPFEAKKTLFDSGLNLYIKKRENNVLNDAYFWEISFLFDLSDFVVPSVPIEIQETQVIIQENYPLEVGRKSLKLHPISTLKTVSLLHYWKMHFFAYILGLDDLKSQNLGITKEGHLLLFDNEYCFVMSKKPFVKKESFKIGLASVSLDWPHYLMPLDLATIAELTAFIEKLSNIKEKLHAYFEIRKVPYSLEPIFERLDEVTHFVFEEELTFRDFYAYLYPRVAEGLDELSHIVSSALKRNVGHGIALYYAAFRSFHFVPPPERVQIENWIQKYVL